MSQPPVLWSFRRCPYAMRARYALLECGIEVEVREIVLRDKPEAFLQHSSDKTVPVLVLEDGAIIAESRDIIFWACAHSVHGQQLQSQFNENGADNKVFLDRLEGEFKHHLDRYKYSTRYKDDPAQAASYRTENRKEAARFIWDIETSLTAQPYLGGDRVGICDIASLPFIRQFRIADPTWFDAQDWTGVKNWLQRFLNSSQFSKIMVKYTPWQEGDEPVFFKP